MKLAGIRAGVCLSLASLLQACGGGSGDSESGGRLVASPSTVAVAASPGDYQPTGNVEITLRNRPSGQLYLGAAFSTFGIASLDFNSTANSTGNLTIVFKPPHSVPDGTHNDTIEFHVCTDETCTNDISGSPITIRTSYEVSGGVVATLAGNPITTRTSSEDDTPRERSLGLTLDRAPVTGFVVIPEFTTNALRSVTPELSTDVDTSITFQFRPGSELLSGTYDDTVTLNVCYDASCVQQLEGAPFTVPAQLVVDVGAEPGFTPLEVASQIALSHDVVDAEFSKPLNAIVMVATYPANALYIYDVETGLEVQQALGAIPTAVSVSPDGLSAAVGHDGLVSAVDLTTVGQGGAPVPATFDVGITIFDLVLDGRGRTHAFAADGQWGAIHTVDFASGLEAMSTSHEVYAGSRGRLHPSGNDLYSPDIISLDAIDKWDVTADYASWRYESTYPRDHYMCGNLWFKEDGAKIYTACGHAFNASDVQADDLTYAGTLELTDPPWGFRIRSLSQSDAQREVALIEYDYDHCERSPDTGQCYTHLALYDGDNLSRQAVYSIPVIHVIDRDYAQHGLFVFHQASGAQKYLISRLKDMPDRDTEYYLSVVD